MSALTGPFCRLRVAVARNRSDAAPVPDDLAPLIERTFRYTHMIATKMRDGVTREGRAEEMDRVIKDARKLQDSRRGNPSK